MRSGAGVFLAGFSFVLAQVSGPAAAQFAPPPPGSGSVPNNGYAPPPPEPNAVPNNGYAPPPPGLGTVPNNGYAPPPPGYRPVPNNGYAPPPPGYGYAPPPPYGRPQGGQGFAGTLRCESRGLRFERCQVPTQGRVVLLADMTAGGQCIQGQNWGHDNRSIWVTAGCRAEFGYGYGQVAGIGRPQPGYPGGHPGGGYPGAQQGGFAGQLACESRNYAYQRCSVPTQGRVVLARQLGGQCIQGQSWGYDQGSIWVADGCRAEFAYGYGRNQPNGGGGPSTGAVIGGVAVAAGLAALLAGAGKKPAPQTAAGSARITGLDTGRLPGVQRDAVNACMAEAARQIGATGGTELRVAQLLPVSQQNGGEQAVAAMTDARYPDETRRVSIDCLAQGGRVISLNFR